VVFLARGVRWLDITTAARRAGFVLPAVVVAINGCMMAVKAVRLRLLLRNPAVSFRACFLALLTSSALNNVTPFRGGDVARLWMLQQTGGVTKSAALAIAVVENLVQLLVLAAIGFLASLMVPGQNWATVAAPIVFFGAATVLIVLRVTTGWAAGESEPGPNGGRGGLRARIRDLWRRLEPGAGALSERGLAVRAVGLSLVAWICEGVMVAATGALWLGVSLMLRSTPRGKLAGVVSGAVAFALLYHAVQVIPVTIAGVVVLSRLGMTLRGLPVRADLDTRHLAPSRRQAPSAIHRVPTTNE